MVPPFLAHEKRCTWQKKTDFVNPKIVLVFCSGEETPTLPLVQLVMFGFSFYFDEIFCFKKIKKKLFCNKNQSWWSSQCWWPSKWLDKYWWSLTCYNLCLQLLLFNYSRYSIRTINPIRIYSKTFVSVLFLLFLYFIFKFFFNFSIFAIQKTLRI